MAAFLAAPGPSQNLDAARVILEAMASPAGPAGVRDRVRGGAPARAWRPDVFPDLLVAR